MTLLRRLRRRGKKILETVAAASGIDSMIDRGVFARASGDAPAEVPSHVLIAPPGGGNVGDQAMVESFLENTLGPIRVIVRYPDDIRIPPQHATRARLDAIPALLYGGGRAHRRAVAELRPRLASALTLTVVGADIMDGAYNLRASVRRADVATWARNIGVDARILGFSWNARARGGAHRALARAGRAGAHLLLRDPLSASRARADGLTNVIEVADCVFSAQGSSLRAAREFLGDSPGPYAVVNASGLVGRSGDQTAEYAGIVGVLLEAGLTVVMVPHVVRSSADDAAACRSVCERVDDERVILVERALEPAEVRGLCSFARLVVAGRMHLAIQSFWSGVPAITLSTQGKVEGLMQLFGTEALCVEPGPGLARRVSPLISEILENPEVYRSAISSRLPAVRVLAALNFPALAQSTRTQVAANS
ncbi:MAG: hypothetical protein JWQ68_2440 [Cryobacterium sp.]|nr:hypothetical protein [Cryobacterium sp.]